MCNKIDLIEIRIKELEKRTDSTLVHTVAGIYGFLAVVTHLRAYGLKKKFVEYGA